MANKKVLPTAIAIVLLPVGLGVAVGGATYLAYRDNHMKCDAPLAHARLTELGVDLPPAATVCRETKRGDSVDLDVVVESPSIACFATAGFLGCPSLASAALRLVAPMTDAGWGTGDDAGPRQPDSETIEFVRKGQRARMMLFRSRYGEITGTFTIDGARKPTADDED